MALPMIYPVFFVYAQIRIRANQRGKSADNYSKQKTLLIPRKIYMMIIFYQKTAMKHSFIQLSRN